MMMIKNEKFDANWENICKDHYIINEELHDILISGYLPQDYIKSFKPVDLDKPGVYMVVFRRFKRFDNIFVYKWIFYPYYFIDVLLFFLILRKDFTKSLAYSECRSDYFTFIDESLCSVKYGIMKHIIDNPIDCNEYCSTFDYKSYYKSPSLNVINVLSKFVYIKNIYAMNTYLNLLFNCDNFKFAHDLNSKLVDKSLSVVDENHFSKEENMNLLNRCVFFVRDLTKFKNILQKNKEIVITKGSGKWRDQVDSSDSFLSLLDKDFRDGILKYNAYHINKHTIFKSWELSDYHTSFENIHYRLGNSKI